MRFAIVFSNRDMYIFGDSPGFTLRFVQLERVYEFNCFDDGPPIVLGSILHGHLNSIGSDILNVLLAGLSMTEADTPALLRASGARSPADRAYAISINKGAIGVLPGTFRVAKRTVNLLALGAFSRRSTEATVIRVRLTH